MTLPRRRPIHHTHAPTSQCPSPPRGPTVFPKLSRTGALAAPPSHPPVPGPAPAGEGAAATSAEAPGASATQAAGSGSVSGPGGRVAPRPPARPFDGPAHLQNLPALSEGLKQRQREQQVSGEWCLFGCGWVEVYMYMYM